ncbi:hypothetical protein ES703_94359 [subsurface metagenome]
MEKGLSKYWTPEQEEHHRKLLATARTFAERDLIMSIRDLLKYDLRTKEGKKAIAQRRLRIATASDKELEQMAKLEAQIRGNGSPLFMKFSLAGFKIIRAEIREKGIKRGELECQQHQE